MIDDLLEQNHVAWSASVINLGSGKALTEHGADKLLKTASVPKLILLMEVADRICAGTLDPDVWIDRRAAVPADGSGLWRHLAQDVLPLRDVAALVGALSDNVATNALLDLVGIDAVAARGRAAGCQMTQLNDYIRTERVPGEHPTTVSVGTARELAALCMNLDRLHLHGDPSATKVLSWLGRGADCSMVLRSFGLDPLSREWTPGEAGTWNKTGTDEGVRADVGVITGAQGSVAYALIANWLPGTVSDRDVLETMESAGVRLRRWCSA